MSLNSLVRSAALAAALSLPTLAGAQAMSCSMPNSFRMPRVEPQDDADTRRTPVTRYTLSLSWSPQYCHGQRERSSVGRDDLQCGGATGRFGFILHGLWPETNGRDWPQYCRPATAVSRATLSRHLCMTPSAQLLQHEWQRHGSCMSATPEAYFAQGAALYANVRYPNMLALAYRRDLTVGEFRRAFSAANIRIPEHAIAITRNRSGWLDEVRLCLNIRFRATRCPAGARGDNDGQRLRISPPVTR
jgi:ribonuclease T2